MDYLLFNQHQVHHIILIVGSGNPINLFNHVWCHDIATARQSTFSHSNSIATEQNWVESCHHWHYSLWQPLKLCVMCIKRENLFWGFFFSLTLIICLWGKFSLSLTTLYHNCGWKQDAPSAGVHTTSRLHFVTLEQNCQVFNITFQAVKRASLVLVMWILSRTWGKKNIIIYAQTSHSTLCKPAFLHILVK